MVKLTFAFPTALVCAALSMTAGAQTAATFPTRTVTLVVPFTPSSGSDIIARLVAPKLAAKWGQAVIVDNKPGASGNLGAKQVALAAPDGHTLLMTINTFTMTPAVIKKQTFDTIKDFAPVAKLAEAGFAFAVNNDVPAKDMATLIDYAKKNPGKINYASPGNGTPQHLAMELFKSSAGIDVAHVPYKGIQGAITDLMGGQVQMMFASVPSLLPQAQSGRLRLLAATGTARNPLAPNLPTFKEQGIDVMDSVDAWYGVLAPANTPAEVVVRINKDFIEAINNAEVKGILEKQGMVIRTSTPLQFASLIKSDMARWKKVVVDSKIEPD